MLILTRVIGTKIIINGNIEVTILGIRGHQVRLGINAPKEVTVHREEIHNRILNGEEQKRADQVNAVVEEVIFTNIEGIA